MVVTVNQIANRKKGLEGKNKNNNTFDEVESVTGFKN